MNKKNITIAIISGLFIFSPINIFAATYYVSTTGSDSNTTLQAQSPSTPWLTLQKAENTASDGDIIRVATGTYVENEATTHGWKSVKGMSWIADGPVTIKATSTASRVLYLQSTSTASFKGFTIDAEGSRSWAVYFTSGTGNKTLDSCNFINSTVSALLSVDSLTTNVLVKNSTIQISTGAVVNAFSDITIGTSTIVANGNTDLFTVSGTGTKNLTISNSTINATSTGRIFFVTGTGVNNFTFSSTTLNSSSADTVFYSSGAGTSNFNISNNTVNATGTYAAALRIQNTAGSLNLDTNTFNLGSTLTTGVNISSGSLSPTIKNNKITILAAATSSANVIGLFDQNNVTIEGNTIDTTAIITNNIDHVSITSTGATLSNIIVRNNTFRTRSIGGHVLIVGSEASTSGDGKIDGAMVYGNALYGALYYNPAITPSTVITHGLMVGFNKNALIYDNFVNGVGYGLVLKADGNTYTSGYVTNNMFLNNFLAVRIKGVSNVPLYNNTIYSGLSGMGDAIYVSDNAGVGGVASFNNKNNIIAGISLHAVLVESNSTSGFTSDYNCSQPGSSGYAQIGTTTYSTFASYQSASYDIHGCGSGILFVNSSSGTYSTPQDFMPAALSSVIDAGISVPGRTVDRIGNPIYGAPDIGQYEYQPPYLIGVNAINPTGNVRIYQNGKYRYTAATSSTASASLDARPVGGYASSTYGEYLNISNIVWTDSSKSWTASSSIATSTVFTLGQLSPNTAYNLKIDGIASTILTSDNSGVATFVYGGGWSTHTFALDAIAAPVAAIAEAPRLSAGSSGGTSAIPDSLKQFISQNTSVQASISAPTFTRSLSAGMSNLEVKTLQQFLNTKGFIVSISGAGSKGKETTLFGPATKNALIRFQKANGISPAVGFFGPVTRAFIANIK